MKVDRLVSIIMVLLDKKRIGAQELADLFEVSPRTIYRDIDTINMAGIPIRSTPGAGGGFEIMQEYKVNNKVFSAAELSAILMGLSNISGMIRGDELAHALAKVRSFIPAEKAKEIEVKANQVCIDLSPWMGSRNTALYLEMVKTALQESRLLSFEYADRYGNKTARTAEPYQLVLKSSHWYFQGYCHKRNDFRLFRLSRMSSLQLREETFTPRNCPKPQLDFGDMLATMQEEITIRIHNSLTDIVLDYCTSDQISPDGEEYCIVRFPFIENDYYYNILLSFGGKCECLGPLPIREELARRIHEMAAIYEG